MRKHFWQRFLPKWSTKSTQPRAEKPSVAIPAGLPQNPVSLRRLAVNNILTLPLTDESEIRKRVREMTPEELIWTINASTNQLRWRARQNADRLTKDLLPLNPWWYH